MKCNKVIFFFLFLLSFSVFSKTPTFSEYNVGAVYDGVNHSLVEPQSGNASVDALRISASHKKANFSGHFYLYTFGCGGGAICGEILDLKTGRVVTGLPDAYDGSSFDLDFKPNSSLLIIYGTGLSGAPSDEENAPDVVVYYNFNSIALKKL